MIFSVAQIVNYQWDHDSVYGKTIECGGMICEREMSLAGDGKQLKKVMTECPMVENCMVYPSVCMMCRVEEGLSRSEQHVRYFYNMPPLGVASCLAKPWLALMQRQPWLALIQRQPVNPSRLSASAHVSTANTLTLLIKASATVTVYRGHRQTLFLPGIISLFNTCMWITRNNSLVGGRAWAEVWTAATECVTLYCTWNL